MGTESVPGPGPEPLADARGSESAVRRWCTRIENALVTVQCRVGADRSLWSRLVGAVDTQAFHAGCDAVMMYGD
jgi:hypothetical protein